MIQLMRWFRCGLVGLLAACIGVCVMSSGAIAQGLTDQPVLMTSTTKAAVAETRLALSSPVSPVTDLALGDPMFSFAGKRPNNLGVKDGQLAACPGTPNCVSSQSPVADSEHHTAPLSYATSPEKAMAVLKSIVESMDRTKIVTAEGNYLYAEFTSAIMGFVDDVEFYLDEAQSVIHVRSASRLGKSDLGVNRKRVEEIRSQFTAAAQ